MVSAETLDGFHRSVFLFLLPKGGGLGLAGGDGFSGLETTIGT